MIVDLAVKNHSVAAFRIHHRLITTQWVKDGQAAKSKCNWFWGVFTNPNTAVVWPPVNQGRTHVCKIVWGSGTNESGDAAH
jgi:hypothetical protein